MSKRAIARHFCISRDSVDKMIVYSVPLGYRRTAPIKRPKLDGFTEIIDAWLREDLDRPRKQRHTAKRVLDRLRDEHGFTGGHTIVKAYLREHQRRGREMFVPLHHAPGHAQADFGEALVVIGGVEQKAHFFVLDLPHSDACYVRAYPAATAEAWADGHVHAFGFFGRVPLSVLYDSEEDQESIQWIDSPTNGWWRASCRTGRASGRRSSAGCCRTTSSRIATAGRARAMTKAPSRGSSAGRGATSWCRCRGSQPGTTSTFGWKSSAASGRPRSCAATARRSANGFSAISRRWRRCRRRRSKPATRRQAE